MVSFPVFIKKVGFLSRFDLWHNSYEIKFGFDTQMFKAVCHFENPRCISFLTGAGPPQYPFSNAYQ